MHDKLTDNARCDPRAGLPALILKSLLKFRNDETAEENTLWSFFANEHMTSFTTAT
jgi:hypothetical protein